MWRLKIAKGGPWLKSGNSHIGRETWEFDQDFGSKEEREAVDSAREEFKKNRFQMRQLRYFGPHAGNMLNYGCCTKLIWHSIRSPQNI